MSSASWGFLSEVPRQVKPLTFKVRQAYYAQGQGPGIILPPGQDRSCYSQASGVCVRCVCSGVSGKVGALVGLCQVWSVKVRLGGGR